MSCWVAQKSPQRWFQLVPLTEEELRTQEAMSLQMQEQRLAEESRELAKQSALAKLALLGLTEEEARAVIGL
jgi:hypothetical protein